MKLHYGKYPSFHSIRLCETWTWRSVIQCYMIYCTTLNTAGYDIRLIYVGVTIWVFLGQGKANIYWDLLYRLEIGGGRQENRQTGKHANTKYLLPPWKPFSKKYVHGRYTIHNFFLYLFDNNTPVDIFCLHIRCHQEKLVQKYPHVNH